MVYAKKIQDVTLVVLLNLALAVLIFINAEAGRLLGIKTLSLNFSAVWPATGFSLAALLIFGFRLWPGILLGNMAYNFLHLYLAGGNLTWLSVVALSISLGSLLQAVVGAYIIRKYATLRYFATVKDVVLFLFFGGVVTCMIASSIGVASLYVYGDLAVKDIFYTWITFWLGDTLGVYIFTPLLVVWAVSKPEVGLLYLSFERVCMLVVFGVISYFTFNGYPFCYLFVPFAIWVTYRLSFHGITLALVGMTLATVVPISMGIGPFIINFTTEMLLIIVSFLEIIASTSLLFAAVTCERNAAWELIKMHRLDLLQK